LRGIFIRNSSPIWLRVKKGVMRTYYDFKIRRRGYHCFLIRHKARSRTSRHDGMDDIQIFTRIFREPSCERFFFL